MRSMHSKKKVKDQKDTRISGIGSSTQTDPDARYVLLQNDLSNSEAEAQRLRDDLQTQLEKIRDITTTQLNRERDGLNISSMTAIS